LSITRPILFKIILENQQQLELFKSSLAERNLFINSNVAPASGEKVKVVFSERDCIDELIGWVEGVVIYHAQPNLQSAYMCRSGFIMQIEAISDTFQKIIEGYTLDLPQINTQIGHWKCDFEKFELQMQTLPDIHQSIFTVDFQETQAIIYEVKDKKNSQRLPNFNYPSHLLLENIYFLEYLSHSWHAQTKANWSKLVFFSEKCWKKDPHLALQELLSALSDHIKIHSSEPSTFIVLIIPAFCPTWICDWIIDAGFEMNLIILAMITQSIAALIPDNLEYQDDREYNMVYRIDLYGIEMSIVYREKMQYSIIATERVPLLGSHILDERISYFILSLLSREKMIEQQTFNKSDIPFLKHEIFEIKKCIFSEQTHTLYLSDNHSFCIGPEDLKKIWSGILDKCYLMYQNLCQNAQISTQKIKKGFLIGSIFKESWNRLFFTQGVLKNIEWIYSEEEQAAFRASSLIKQTIDADSQIYEKEESKIYIYLSLTPKEQICICEFDLNSSFYKYSNVKIEFNEGTESLPALFFTNRHKKSQKIFMGKILIQDIQKKSNQSDLINIGIHTYLSQQKNIFIGIHIQNDEIEQESVMMFDVKKILDYSSSFR
jgi:hypothetical protein